MDVNLLPLLPALQVLVPALVVTMRDLFIKEASRAASWRFTASSDSLWPRLRSLLLLCGGQESAFNDSIMLDRFALFFAMIFIMAAALTILILDPLRRQTGIHEGEFYALILFATVGMIRHGGGQRFDRFLSWLGDHVDRGLRAHRHVARQRPLQRSIDEIFLMGAFATGFLLYGIALIYGATGSTN